MKQLLPILFNSKKLIQRFCLSILVWVAVTQIWAMPAQATGIYEIPGFAPETWVVDQADVLSRASEGKLTREFETLAQETGNQVRFVTLHRLDYGETPQSFADKLFEKWFPTPEAQANQALVVLDSVTNGTAIHAGDQVKAALPDAIAQSVIGETMQVPLRQGNNYNQAFIDASDRLLAVLSGQPDPGPPQVVEVVRTEGTFKKAEETETGNATIVVIGLLLAATIIPMATYYWYQAR